MNTCYYLICYDINQDHIRNSVMKFLKDKGYHLQKSVFIVACNNPKDATNTYNSVYKIVNSETDSVFMVPLCQSCLKKIQTFSQLDFSGQVWVV